MGKILRLFSFVTIWVLAFAMLSFAQERTGNINGTVNDPNSQLLPGAQVQVIGLGIGFDRTVQTDGNGKFVLLQVPPGRYKVSVSASGFQKAEAEITVTLGLTQTVNFNLKVGDAAATVDITAGDVAAIDSEANKIQTNISERRIELTPKATTNFAGLLTIAPAVRNEPLGAGFQVDGSSGAENTFIVDGLEVTNFRSGQLRNVQNVSNDIVSEVQIKTSGFEAEFSGATGGVVTVVTKGGNNTFHGNFGVQFESDRLNANTRPILRGLEDDVQFFKPTRDGGNTFLNPKDDEFTNFFPTGNLSGPIIKDRLWFFASAAPQFVDTERTTVFEAGGRETNQSDQRNDYAFARLDAQVTDTIRATGTYSYSPQTINGGILPFGSSSIGDQSQKGGRVNAANVTAGASYTPNSTLVVSARFGRAFLNELDGSYGVPDGFRVRCSGSQTVLNNIPIVGNGVGCGATTPTQLNGTIGFDNIGNTSNVTKDVSIRRTFDADAQLLVNDFGGRHIFKFGYQYNHITNDVDNGFFSKGQFRFFFGSTSFGIGSALGNAQLTQFGTFGKASSTNKGIFVQDSWQPVKRLTLNLGVRFEKENVPSFGTVGVPIEFNWGDKIAPRIGGAYDVFGDGTTKVFASWGRFFDRFKYELPRGSFGGDLFLRTFIPILPTDTVNTFTSIASVLAASQARGGITLDFRVPSNSPEDNRVDPNLDAARLSEYTFGVEHELSRYAGFLKDFVVRARYTHKQVDRAIEDVGFVDDVGNENFFIANPGFGVVAEPFAAGLPATPKAKRDYDAFEVTVDKRFSNNYFFSGTYTYSQLDGNYSGLASSDERGRSSPNVNRFFDLPFLGFDVNGNPDNGKLATDRPHAVKIFGAYTLDWFKKGTHQTDFTVGFLGTSGSPLSSQVSFFNANTFLFGRGDLGRTPKFTQTDFAITHRIKLGEDSRYSAAFEVNITNLFDESNVTDVFTQRNVGSIAGTEKIGTFKDANGKRIQTGVDSNGNPIWASATVNLFNNCPGGTCDEVNSFRAIFAGGLQSQLVTLLTTDVPFVRTFTDFNGNTVTGTGFESVRQDARFGQSQSFQSGRQVRFGIRFSF